MYLDFAGYCVDLTCILCIDGIGLFCISSLFSFFFYYLVWHALIWAHRPHSVIFIRSGRKVPTNARFGDEREVLIHALFEKKWE